MRTLPRIVACVTLSCISATALAEDMSAALQRLFGDERAFLWRADPLTATYDGVHEYDDRLPSVTPASQATARHRPRGPDAAGAGELRPVRFHGHAAHRAGPAS